MRSSMWASGAIPLTKTLCEDMLKNGELSKRYLDKILDRISGTPRKGGEGEKS
jgi:hypothetical protein